MTEEIDTKFTDEVICPYCDFEYTDSWEVTTSPFNVNVACEKCKKVFTVCADFSVTYCTYKTDTGKKGGKL